MFELKTNPFFEFALAPRCFKLADFCISFPLHFFTRRGVETHPHNPCFGVRTFEEDGKTRGEYEWEDYKSVLAKVKDLSSGLRRIDLLPVRHSQPLMRILTLHFVLCTVKYLFYLSIRRLLTALLTKCAISLSPA